MVETFIAWWAAHVPLSPKLSVFLVSMIPLIEERGGLILARMLGIPMWEGIFWCVFGNIVPIPFILLLIKSVIHWMADHHMSGIAEWLIRKAEKNKPKIDRYGFAGLMLFVGIISVLWGDLPYFDRLRRTRHLPYTACFVEAWASWLGEKVTHEKAIWE